MLIITENRVSDEAKQSKAAAAAKKIFISYDWVSPMQSHTFHSPAMKNLV
jgi:hypothetical protein